MVQFDGSQFQWKQSHGLAHCSELGITSFPREFTIVSPRTRKSMTFIADNARNLENEFFDGEGSAYISQNDAVRVMLWV